MPRCVSECDNATIERAAVFFLNTARPTCAPPRKLLHSAQHAESIWSIAYGGLHSGHSARRHALNHRAFAAVACCQRGSCANQGR